MGGFGNILVPVLIGARATCSIGNFLFNYLYTVYFFLIRFVTLLTLLT